MRVFYCDHFEVPLPPGHRFPMAKYRQLREALLERGVLKADVLVPSVPMERGLLELVHAPAYLDALFGLSLGEREVRRLGFPWSQALLERSRASAFGTLAAARVALESGIAGNLAGGTHHAFADHGEGFCVFNDLAVAIRALQREGRIRRALIVDLDVHQGNGTAAIFEGDASVFTFSMHGEKNFPFRKQRSSLDVGLEDGAGDAAYLEVLDRHLPEVFDSAAGDLCFFQAGVDPLAEDTLGRLTLTHAGLKERDRRVLEAARCRGMPIVLTLGGGYANPLSATVEAHVGTYEMVREVIG